MISKFQDFQSNELWTTVNLTALQSQLIDPLIMSKKILWQDWQAAPKNHAASGTCGIPKPMASMTLGSKNSTVECFKLCCNHLQRLKLNLLGILLQGSRIFSFRCFWAYDIREIFGAYRLRFSAIHIMPQCLWRVRSGQRPGHANFIHQDEFLTWLPAPK